MLVCRYGLEAGFLIRHAALLGGAPPSPALLEKGYQTKWAPALLEKGYQTKWAPALLEKGYQTKRAPASLEKG
jgi:hypothetical protein